MTVTRKSFRKAVYMALLLSVFGLALVCLPIVGLKYTMEFANAWLPQIAVGYAAMILVIELVGIPLRSSLSRYWAGAIFAFFLFILGAACGAATSMLRYQDPDAYSCIVKPLYWLGLFGFIPAAIIGIIGSWILRWTNQNGDPGDSQHVTPNR